MAKCDIMSLLIRAKTCRMRIHEWQIGATCIVQVCGSSCSSGHTQTNLSTLQVPSDKTHRIWLSLNL